MRNLLLIPIIASIMFAVALPGRIATAKGGNTAVIGGRELSPYVTVVSNLPPGEGPLGLGPRAAEASAATASEAALLDASYDLYFPEDLQDMAASRPTARYVPATEGHPAYLRWTSATGVLRNGGWYELGPVALSLDAALKDAIQRKALGAQGMQTDPVSALALQASNDVNSKTYVVATNGEFLNGAPPVARFTGDAAARLRDAYVASLHDVSTTTNSRPRAKEYGVYGEGARQPWFTYTPSRDGRGVLQGFAGGSFVANEELDAMISSAIAGNKITSLPAAGTDGSDRRSAATAAAAVAVAFVIAVGGGAFAIRRRRTR